MVMIKMYGGVQDFEIGVRDWCLDEACGEGIENCGRCGGGK